MLRIIALPTAAQYLARINTLVLAQTATQLGTEKNSKHCPGGVLAVQLYSVEKPEISDGGYAIVGQPGDNLDNNVFFAHEKIRRLRLNRKQGFKHYAASQSADPDQERYAGCIVGTTQVGPRFEVYTSFSGAPAKIDEALVYLMARENFNLDVPLDYENEWLDRARRLTGPFGEIA